MATGLAFLPMTLLTAVVSPTAARLAASFGPRMPIITGQLLMATGLVALCVPPASAPAWLLVLLMIPVGTGGGLAVPAVTSLLLDRVPAQRAGTARIKRLCVGPQQCRRCASRGRWSSVRRQEIAAVPYGVS